MTHHSVRTAGRPRLESWTARDAPGRAVLRRGEWPRPLVQHTLGRHTNTTSARAYPQNSGEPVQPQKRSNASPPRLLLLTAPAPAAPTTLVTHYGDNSPR